MVFLRILHALYDNAAQSNTNPRWLQPNVAFEEVIAYDRGTIALRTTRDPNRIIFSASVWSLAGLSETEQNDIVGQAMRYNGDSRSRFMLGFDKAQNALVVTRFVPLDPDKPELSLELALQMRAELIEHITSDESIFTPEA